MASIRCAAPASAFSRVAVVARDRAGLLRRLVELADDVGAARRSHSDRRPIGRRPPRAPSWPRHIWSATTATASSMRTTWRTPLTARAAASLTDLGLAAEHGRDRDRRDLHPRHPASMPNCARPLTFSGMSRRLAGVPISVKSFGSFSATLSAPAPAARQRRPPARRSPSGARSARATTTPRFARQVPGSTPQRLAAAAISIVRADRAGLAQAASRTRGPRSTARWSGLQHRVGVQRVVGRRVLEPHLIEADLQFLREQHGNGGVDALAHLDHRHHQRHDALASMRMKAFGAKAGGAVGAPRPGAARSARRRR